MTIFQKASFYMLDKILTFSEKPVTTCEKSPILDIWQGFEFAFVTINYFRKKVLTICLLNLINILYIKQYMTVHGKIDVT